MLGGIRFKDAPPETKASEGDLVILDYTATVDGKTFKVAMLGFEEVV